MYATKPRLARLAFAVLAAAVFVAAPGTADAHAHLRAAEPPEAIVDAAGLREIRLVFSEPVVGRFSTFRAFRLSLPENGIRNLTQLNTLASELEVDTEESVHHEVELESDLSSQSAEVTLHSDEPLPAGAYAVVWRVLSVDGHTTTGFHAFVHAGGTASGH
ncbi:copper resistance protein CopC [Thioalkalivibrio nitratireducens DSM 14787]|uniref:Copper resistance protein CopC n=1 Tax=Thioalkalivibrio nitratireducens (strain DSM 14787 / UNIQEM 213 / ALEN2) TaxID=1255043 RepID=L0DZN1_THIND|nr:copper resistance CopC family protein [Thioalkalivibrio nitratireducens]AGA34400.1 copper resistance protein CopC [Thioalkalivibrio nitratireducens DSM 14787]